MVNDIGLWWENHYVGFSLYQIGRQHPESVTNIWKLSPTHFVSKIRHQHWCNRGNRFKFGIILNDFSSSTIWAIQIKVLFTETLFQLEDALSWLGISDILFFNIRRLGYRWYAAYDQKSSNWKRVWVPTNRVQNLDSRFPNNTDREPNFAVN